MANVPSDLKYAKSHEWIRVAGDAGTVGISDHAQHELTDVVFVELPAVGRKVKAGETYGAAYVVGYFDDVSAMEKAYDAHTGKRRIVLEDKKWRLDNLRERRHSLYI